MPADPANAHIWTEADVYASFDLAAVIPADAATPFSVAWSIIGFLDGDDGFTTSQSQDKKDSFAWGGFLLRTTRKNYKLTKSFSPVEMNDVVNRLTWPNSTGAMISIPKIEPVKLAFETRDGAFVRRLVTVNYAEVEVDGDVAEKETELAKIKFVATIFPNAAGELLAVLPAMDYLVDA